MRAAKRAAGRDTIAAHLIALGRALSLPAAHMYIMGTHLLGERKRLGYRAYGKYVKTLPFADRTARKYKGIAQRMNGWIARNGTLVPLSVVRQIVDGEATRDADEKSEKKTKRAEGRTTRKTPVEPKVATVQRGAKLAAPRLVAAASKSRRRSRSQRESVEIGKSRLIFGDAFQVMAEMGEASVHAVVTDPPFSAREFEPEELRKLESGTSGVWRAGSPSDGYQRARQPLFCTMTQADRAATSALFERIGRACARVLLPGGYAIVACHDSLLPLVLRSVPDADLAYVGLILRTFSGGRGGMPARGSDACHPNTCTMPRTDHEPWVVLRRRMPAGMTVRQCLATFGTGALARPAGAMLHSVIPSRRLARPEKKLGGHPCQKPQAFMRQIVRAVLPLGDGIVLDPFAGSGSTVAACQYVGVQGIGIERHREYFERAAVSVRQLALFEPE